MSTRRLHGKNALGKLNAGERQFGRPLLFLDFDDVVTVNSPYGGYDLFTADAKPDDLYERLWHPPSMQTLLTIMAEHQPWVIVTTSWLRMMERHGFEALFRRTGLAAVADALHEKWEAPPNRGMTRLQAIEKWLAANYRGEPLIILDDELSGTGLRGSWLDKAGCVVLCQQDVGLHAGHLPAVARALKLPS